MKTIPLEQKVVTLRLPSFDSESDCDKNVDFEKVVEITMQIKKVPKLTTEDRVKQARKQATKTTAKPKPRIVSEVIDNPSHLEVDLNLTKAQKVQATKKGKEALAPKKPLTAYMYFNMAVNKTVREENPSLKFTEISGVVSEKWKSLCEKDKKHYEDLSN